MAIEELSRTLNRIGLSVNEAKLYLTLLRIGTSKAGKVAKDCGLNRTTTYDVLKILIEKGLVSYFVQANRKWFEATDPRRLNDFLTEKIFELKKILPELQKIKKLPKQSSNITVFYGSKGMRTVFQDMIKERHPIFILDSEEQLARNLPYYVNYFIKQVENKKIPIKHILRDAPEVKAWWFDTPPTPPKTTEVRFVQKKTKSTSSLEVYGDKVAIFIWRDPPEAVVIKDKCLANSIKDYFEILWKLGKKK